MPDSARQLTRKASLRYKHQGFELDVDWAGEDVTPEATAKTLESFHDLHEQLYTFAQRDTPVEIVTLHVTAIGTLLQPRLSELASGGALADAEIDRAPVHFEEGVRTVPIYDREKLSAGVAFEGPALVVQLDSTTLVLPDQTATVDPSGSLILKSG